MESVLQDLRYGLRALKKNPGFTAAAVLSLALGLGANLAIFSFIEAILIRPLAVKNPEQLVALYTSSTRDSGLRSVSYPDYLDFKELSEAFSGLTAYGRVPLALNPGSHTERVWAEVVSANYFAVLGVSMQLGRGFLPQEDTTRGRDFVVVLSYGLWNRAFGHDPAIVGRQITVSGQRWTVVGIAPENFKGVVLDWGAPPEVWIPLSMHEDGAPAFRGLNLLEKRDGRWLLVTGRLRAGITVEEAEAAVRVRASQLEAAFEKTNRGWTTILLPIQEARFWPTYRRSVSLFLSLLLFVAGSVLLLGCANAANMLLARSITRRREIGIRLALGAKRARLVQQLLTEGILLTVLALLASAGVAFAIVQLLLKFPIPFQVPLAIDLAVNHRILGFAILLAAGTSLVFGVVPALHATRMDPRDVLQEAGATGFSSKQSKLRQALVVIQIAISVLLLIGAGLFTRSLWRARAVVPGFRSDHVLIVSVDLNILRFRYDETKGMAFFQQVLDRLASLPGVRSATWAGDTPLQRFRLIVMHLKDDRLQPAESDWIQSDCNVVGPGYFETLGIPLVRGRDFSHRDDEKAPGVLIVNETMARQFWPGEDAIGKRIRVRGRAREIYQIIGVARDTKYRSLWEEPPPYLYLPFLQRYFPNMTLHVRTQGGPMELLEPVRREIAALDLDLPLFDARPLSQQVSIALAQQRMASTLLGAAGFLALALSVLGVYGVLSYTVAQRAREIGIRMALGAAGSDILGMVLCEGMALGGIGIALGAALAFLSSRFVSGYLHGVTATDPAVFAGVTLSLFAVIFLACLIPSRRASRVDPALSLRTE